MQKFFKIQLEEINEIFNEKNLKEADRLSNDRIVEAYELMVTVRKFEERAGDLYAKGKIAGFCHLYIGQEAVAVGNYFASNKDDTFITSYRDHGLMLASGADPVKIMAELTGKEIGCSRGKGGSMHIFDIKKKFYGGHGIVGAQSSLGTGLAFEIKYNNKPNVSYTYMGDGAANQGQFYESMNIASLWNLPVIYIIENNQYAMGTATGRATYDTNLSNRGLPFGIAGHQVNGMDFFEVYNAIKLASNYVRETSRPIVLEMKTYRYRGHSMSDPAQYRSKEEVNSFKIKDPIDHLKSYLIDNKILTKEYCEEIESKIYQDMIKVASEAVEAKELDVSELYTDVYND